MPRKLELRPRDVVDADGKVSYIIEGKEGGGCGWLPLAIAGVRQTFDSKKTRNEVLRRLKAKRR